MADSANAPSAEDEHRTVLDELRGDPRPAVHRAALAIQHPRWGVSTLGLLVVGLVGGFASLDPLAHSIDVCASDPARFVCGDRIHPVLVALPVVALVAGLAVSLLAGRALATHRRSPLPASVAGWVIFVLGTTSAYLLAFAL